MLTAIAKTKITIMSVEMGGAVILNIFLLVLILRSKKLHRSASLNFIFNCGLSDLVNIMINIPLAMDYSVIKTGNLDGSVMPVVVRFMITFLLLLSFHSTLIMMADRYFIVKYPVKYNNTATAKRARFAIALLWLSTILFSGILTGIRFLRNPPLPNDTMIDYMQKQHQSGGKFIVSLVLLTVFTSVAVLCGKLYQVLQTLLKRNPENASMSDVQRLKLQAEKRKVAASCRTVLIVMVIYMLSYFPSLLNSILQIFNVQLTSVENVRAFAILCFANLSSFFQPDCVHPTFIINSKVGS